VSDAIVPAVTSDRRSANGDEAVARFMELRPDVTTLDSHDALRRTG